MDRDEIDAMRRDKDALIAALEALSSRVQGKNAQCPWHDDQTPSASILEEPKTGAWKVYCHVCQRGGDVFDLRETAGGRPVADQLRELNIRQKAEKVRHVFATIEEATDAYAKHLGRTQATYQYANPDTRAVELVVVKLAQPNGKKAIRPLAPFHGGWIMEWPPKPWPIYNRARVLASDRVVVVEGEKCAHALYNLGIVATTAPCGAGKAECADWTPLSGKDVILWPDHDADGTGAKHMADVRRILNALPKPPRIWLVNEKGLGLADDGGDCADIINAVGDPDQAKALMLAIIDDAQPLGASRDVSTMIEDIIAGRRKSVAWPWPLVTALSRALLPGTVTLLCGDPGSGKSFFLLQSAIQWAASGESMAILEMEEDRTYHLRRALALLDRNGRLFDDSWIAGHPAEAREAHRRHERVLDELGMRMSESPDAMKLPAVADWIEARARAGVRIIVVDPITAAATSDKPWNDDLAFVMRAKAVAKETGASIVLAIHPKKAPQSGKPQGLSDMAGGAAYQRFAQCVLWLQAFMPKSLSTADGDRLCNRGLVILKSRNGPGHGTRIAMNFDGATLSFTEHGVITKETKVVPDKRLRKSAQPQDSEDLWGNP